MSDDKKPTLEEARANPDRYKILDSGAIYDREAGRIVGMGGKSKYAITPANASEMSEKSNRKRKIGKVVGRILGAGLELPADADLEKLTDLEADAVTIYTAHLGKVFLESKNPRIGESFSKLTGDDEGQRGGAPGFSFSVGVNADAELAQQFAKIISDVLAYKARQVIDVQSQDVSEGE
jgi:hypothetical protein